jgi:hypothetical protein
MSQHTFKNEYVNCVVSFLPSGKIHISGKIEKPSLHGSPKTFPRVFAPKSIDRMTNYSGSGLPFPCASVAFDRSPNNHYIDSNGHFDVEFTYPNGYYLPEMFKKIAPSIFFSLNEPNMKPFLVQFELPDHLPLRTLVDRPNHSKGPMFYSVKEDLIPIASACDTMLYYSDAKIRYDIA